MKLLDLLRHLASHHCVLVREGANHSIFVNFNNNQQTADRAIGKLAITRVGPSASS